MLSLCNEKSDCSSSPDETLLVCPCFGCAKGDPKGEAHKLQTPLCNNPQGIYVPQQVSRVSLGKEGLRRSLLMDTQQCWHCPELQASLEQWHVPYQGRALLCGPKAGAALLLGYTEKARCSWNTKLSSAFPQLHPFPLRYVQTIKAAFGYRSPCLVSYF